MAANTGAPEPVDLFVFLRTVEVAAARKKLTRQQERVARLVAYDSDATTGSGVVVNAKKVGTELGISSRQVWTHFKALIEAGWFVQTTAPTRGIGSSPGRRAKYQCTTPVLDLGLMSADDLPPAPEQLPFPEPAEPVDNPPNRVKPPSAESAHETPDNRVKVPSAESALDPTGVELSFEGFDDNRVKVLEESFEGPERENFTHSPSGGTPSDVTPNRGTSTNQATGRARAAESPPVENPAPLQASADWATVIGRVRDQMAEAVRAHPRHARPNPEPITRPDRE